MLSVQNLCVSVDGKSIIKNCSFKLEPGKIHVLMGPNGSGKSSLVYTLMGHPSYQVDQGSILFEGKNIVDMPAHHRSLQGMYLSMQQPSTIAGLQVIVLLEELYKIHGNKDASHEEFFCEVQALLPIVGLSEAMLYRAVNDNFSGGERKRFEILQMMLLKPKLALLDEIDSGVDIDGLTLIASALEQYQKENPQSSIIIVTHYRRILKHLKPDMVHVMMNGELACQGDASLIDHIEHKGYEQYAKRAE